MPPHPAPKLCAACGRAITWRKKWARDWDAVKFCGDACRMHKHSAVDDQMEATILTLLNQRAKTATICPSEAARSVGGDNWPSLMEPARRAARRLVAAGKIVITQRGHVVDPSTAKGPIRLKRV